MQGGLKAKGLEGFPDLCTGSFGFSPLQANSGLASSDAFSVKGGLKAFGLEGFVALA